jgi:uncharacterized phage protein (TIGR02220 family)
MSKEPRKSQITDDGAAHKYFGMIPHTVTRGKRGRGLSLPARWLYVYYKSIAGEGGVCNKSTTSIVNEAQLGRGTIPAAKEELIKAGLIRVVSREGKYHATDQVRLVDIWPENMQEFKSEGCSSDEQQESCSGHEQPYRSSHEQPDCSPGEQPVSTTNSMVDTSSCSPHEQRGCSPHERGCSPHEPKKKDLKKNLEPQDLNPPPLPPYGVGNGVGVHDAMARSYDRQGQLDAQEVLAYLNHVTGMAYETLTFIRTILGAGATVEECKLVIDWWKKVWTIAHPNQVDYFDYATPFKADKFDKYRAAAKRWDAGGQLAPQSEKAPRVSAKGLRNLAVTQQLLKEDGLL